MQKSLIIPLHSARNALRINIVAVSISNSVSKEGKGLCLISVRVADVEIVNELIHTHTRMRLAHLQ